MRLMRCPLNGWRPIAEFICHGEVKPMPDPATASDHEWTDYLFMENNVAGVVREWWFHFPSAYWFIAERNTVTGEIVDSYPPTRLFDQRIDFGAAE